MQLQGFTELVKACIAVRRGKRVSRETPGGLKNRRRGRRSKRDLIGTARYSMTKGRCSAYESAERLGPRGAPTSIPACSESTQARK